MATKFEQLTEKIQQAPESFSKLSLGDMQEVIPAIATEVHDQLMKLASGNKKMQDLIFAYSELTFFQHRQKDCDLGDIQAVQDIINSLWGKKKGKGK